MFRFSDWLANTNINIHEATGRCRLQQEYISNPCGFHAIKTLNPFGFILIKSTWTNPDPLGTEVAGYATSSGRGRADPQTLRIAGWQEQGGGGSSQIRSENWNPPSDFWGLEGNQQTPHWASFGMFQVSLVTSWIRWRKLTCGFLIISFVPIDRPQPRLAHVGCKFRLAQHQVSQRDVLVALKKHHPMLGSSFSRQWQHDALWTHRHWNVYHQTWEYNHGLINT